MADLFTIKSSALPAGATVAAFRGREAISELFAFEIGILVRGEDYVDLDGSIGQAASLTMDLGDERGSHELNGVFHRMELLHTWQGQA